MVFCSTSMLALQKRDNGRTSFQAGSTRNSRALWVSESDGKRNSASRPSPHPIRPLGYNGFNAVRWQALFEDCDMNGASSHSDIGIHFSMSGCYDTCLRSRRFHGVGTN